MNDWIQQPDDDEEFHREMQEALEEMSEDEFAKMLETVDYIRAKMPADFLDTLEQLISTREGRQFFKNALVYYAGEIRARN